MLLLGQKSFRWIDVDDHGRECHHLMTSGEMDGTLIITISLWADMGTSAIIRVIEQCCFKSVSDLFNGQTVNLS